ncbi:adenylyl-sulfate kinase [Paenibacillus sp. MZ04-78.2]|uniref:adenylyl-sulfate kinase n=1 Tax=Paenibacillus sp. MZ04-78.2 TaxID=2962034 RepID=UPI0020B78D43|nr:adenylyl-sulfate kinase [Paenibacillus sp. MZ04-78.2]MCP3776512.1 adenylyl-sulfate kinase [Paenibacillus sp. MZ04-78.2]
MNKAVTVWFTGMSGAGKTTISKKVCDILISRSMQVELLDGDILRKGICRDLGFTKEDREKNVERVIYLAKMLNRHNIISLVSLITPYEKSRELARHEIADYIEVYVKTSLQTLIKRDVKGLYKKSINGEIKGFTGIDAPFEQPKHSDLTLDTELISINECAKKVIEILERRGIIPKIDQVIRSLERP